MEEKGCVLATADVRFKVSKAFIITAAVYLVAAVAFVWFSSYSVISWRGDHRLFTLFGFECFAVFEDGRIDVDWLWTSVVFIPYILIIIPAPLYAFLIMQSQSKKTRLAVSNAQIYGSYGGFLTKKQLQMPIKKVDNLVVISGFWDRIRSGKTLGVCSGSGMIKLHFVQNAEEVVAVAMEQIEAARGKEETEPVEKQNISVMDKLKELMSMKEMGIISEEEFAAKKQELLDKM